MSALYVPTFATRPCWHCHWFVAMCQRAAVCSLPNGCRCRAMPEKGCASFEREPGVDDEPGPPAEVDFLTGWRLMPARIPRPPAVQAMLARW